jgi:hypothetical protein
MSAEVEKFSIYDDRVVQTRPKYAVYKGGLAVTNTPFKSITASNSQQVFNVNVPSPNVFLDRAIDWSSDCFVQFQVNIPTAGNAVVGTPVVVLGRDVALAPMPLQQMCSTIVATINDANVTINTSDVLNEVLRLVDMKKNRLLSTAPRMLDKYANYNDAYGATNNTLASYVDAGAYDEVPNGAYHRVQFTDSTGAVLVGSSTYVFGGVTYSYTNGVPVVIPNPANPANPLQTYPIFLKFRSTEKVVLSPFIFSEQHEYETGLYGLSNIQLLCNISNASRVIRSTTGGGRVVSALAFNQQKASAFEDARLDCIFLTPPLSLSLPPRSIVQYTEIPRYISSSQPLVPTGQKVRLESQNIVLSMIPDTLLVWVKPASYTDFATASGLPPSAIGDFHLPISNISINFNNHSGLMNTTSAEELFSLSVTNGLDMDFQTWSGEAKSANAGGRSIPLAGGFLVLKPSINFPLDEGLASGVLGNFNLQFSVDVKNTTGVDIQPVLYVATVNSGFFESQNGSSRIIRGLLDEKAVLEAPLAPAITRGSLSRMVGAGWLSGLASALSKAKEIYSATKPLVSGIKGLLPEGKVKSAMGAVGYGGAMGMTEGEGSYTGGVKMSKRKSVASRLME